MTIGDLIKRLEKIDKDKMCIHKEFKDSYETELEENTILTKELYKSNCYTVKSSTIN